jgi:hypothetical protein
MLDSGDIFVKTLVQAPTWRRGGFQTRPPSAVSRKMIDLQLDRLASGGFETRPYNTFPPGGIIRHHRIMRGKHGGGAIWAPPP